MITKRGSIDNAVTLNRYAYANANPVTNIDPFGLSAERGDQSSWFSSDFAKFIGMIFPKQVATIEALVLVYKKLYTIFLEEYNRARKQFISSTYVSPDLAAIAFSNEVYAASLYIRHEYGTKIYAVTSFGMTRYAYAEPVSGTPHSVSYNSVVIPSDFDYIATAHTHPNSNIFSGYDLETGKIESSGDIPFFINSNIDGYVVTPNLNIQKYDVSENKISIIGSASPTDLSFEQKQSLVKQFENSWNRHLDENCDFGCQWMIWPTTY